MARASTTWPDRIVTSFLSETMKERYVKLLADRRQRLELV
jgi:hypothetical protein